MTNTHNSTPAVPQAGDPSQGDRDYLRLQYQEGANTIRAFIDSRYKILQFMGVYNGAILTIGFSQELFTSPNTAIGALLICGFSALVALMGLATEFSLSSYNEIYFTVLRDIESKLGKTALPEKLGVFTHGRDAIVPDRFHRTLPVYRAHRALYTIVLMFWLGFFIYEVTRL